MKHTTFIESSLPINAVDRTTKFKQLGGMMIESLIGLLLLSVIGGGVMHATARMANTQQQQAMHNISVNQMRSMVMNRKGLTGADLCAANNHTLAIPGQQNPAPVTVKGCGSVNLQIANVKVGTTTLATQTVSSQRPVVLETGTNAELVRVGGAEVANAPAN